MAGIDTNTVHLDQLDFTNSLIRSRKINFEALYFEEPRRRNWEIPYEMFYSQPAADNSYYNRAGENGQHNPFWVTSKEGMDSMITDLNMAHEFCIRVREYDGETRTPVTTWIQIATWDGRDYLVEAMRLQKEIESGLKRILENPGVLKIMIDGEKQIQALQRDFHIFLFPCADVVEFGIAGNPSHSRRFYNFDSLCSRFAAGLKISAPNMRTFLRAETATYAQMDFATHEVHLGLRIFNTLREKMDIASKRTGFKQSLSCPTYSISSRRFNIEATTNEIVSFLTINNMRTPEGDSAQEMNPRERIIFKSLVEWREMMSKVVNLKPEKVMTDFKMFELAKLRNAVQMEEREIYNAIGLLGSIVDRQKKFLVRLLQSEDAEAFMNKNRELVCNQCCLSDHGPISFCFRDPLPCGVAQKRNLSRPEMAEKKEARKKQVDAYFERIKKRDALKEQVLAEIDANPFFKGIKDKLNN